MCLPRSQVQPLTMTRGTCTKYGMHCIQEVCFGTVVRLSHSLLAVLGLALFFCRNQVEATMVNNLAGYAHLFGMFLMLLTY